MNTELPNQFFGLILDSITEHIAVIDKNGIIQYVNKSWTSFGNDNASTINNAWSGVNYLEACDKAASLNDEFAIPAIRGIKNVINGQVTEFYFEYPCHSPHEKRWFMMRVTSLEGREPHYFVITHQDITKRVLAEKKVANLARLDGLTGIPNRRTFDDFLHDEWRRCARLKNTLSLALIDIDYFKLLNDTYGHIAGDECLIKVGHVLKGFASRPDDLHARYGGEEFALIWGSTSLEEAKILANKLLNKINNLNIPNKNSPTNKTLTVSIGLVSIIPDRNSNEKAILEKVDTMLYKAKENGRNRIESE